MKYIFMISLITLFLNGCTTTSKNVETPLKVENEVSITPPINRVNFIN